MILSQADLKSAWKSKLIRFDPDISENQIGLSSIDLRLGYVFARLRKSSTIVRPASQGFDPTNLVRNVDLSSKTLRGNQVPLRLPPRQLILAFTLEKIMLPDSLAANVQGKSSLARAGVAVHITAPHIHPGFTANITLEMYNHGPWHLEFMPGQDLICQVIFFTISKRVSKRQIRERGTYMEQKTPFPRRRS